MRQRLHRGDGGACVSQPLDGPARSRRCSFASFEAPPYAWLAAIAILLSAGASNIADAMTYKDIAGQWCGDVSQIQTGHRSLLTFRHRRRESLDTAPTVHAEFCRAVSAALWRGSVCTADLILAQQLRHLSNIRRDPPRVA